MKLLLVSLSCLLLSFTLHKPGHPGYKPNDVVVSIRAVDKDSIQITVTNNSKRTVAAFSHVICREYEYDYFELEGVTSDNKKFDFEFYDERPTYAPVLALLKPNESFSHRISLTDWSERNVNQAALKKAGLKSLPKNIKLRARYVVSEKDSYNGFIWSGSTWSDWVQF